MDEFYKSFPKDLFALDAMKSMAFQLNELKISHPFLDTLNKPIFPKIEELYPFLNPSWGFLDIIKTTLPTLAPLTTNFDYLSNMPGLTETIKPLIDYKTFFPSQSSIYESIGGLNDIFNSPSFSELQSTLGLSMPTNESISSFLVGVTRDNGATLRSAATENTDEATIQMVIDVLTDRLPFDELPDDVKAGVRDFRTLAYKNSIGLSATVLMVIVLISFMNESNIQNAATLLGTIITILLYMKEQKK